MSFLKPISISLSPNTEKDDIELAFKLLFQCWRWKKGNKIKELEEEFKKYLGVKHAVSFNSGRSALMAILGVLNIKEGDEVLLQGFTCNSAVNPILEKRAKPVFVDVDETLNLDPEDLKRKITGKSKVVMVQHTFGWPAKIDEIEKIAKENQLYLIEDCAHSLGAKYHGRFCGTFGDAAFFSFGRDKVISSIFGGMALTNKYEMGERLNNFQKKLSSPPNFWIFQQLLHPILMNWKVMPAYALHPFWGRLVLGFLHKSGILSKAVYKEEKKGRIGKYFPKLFPNALAILALKQFKKLEKFNNHRKEIADFYKKELENFNLPLAKSQKGIEPVFMRYPVLMKKETEETLREARKRRIFLDDGWRRSPVVPPDTDINKMQYIPASCPWAEKVAKNILNLPTHINISKKEAQIIVDFLKTYGS
jgi:dTDP-4-amino-4,6-dideoxygalactose transaminase